MSNGQTSFPTRIIEAVVQFRRIQREFYILPAPEAPVGVTATPDERSVSLSWEIKNPQFVDSFEIERWGPGDASFKLITTVGSGERQFGDKGLSAGMYSYRVRSCNKRADSDYLQSNEVEVK
jgi:hypothetical protein